MDDICGIIVFNVDGVLICICDVVEVGLGKELCIGVVIENGCEVVFGMVFMLIGENSWEVVQVVGQCLEEINWILFKGVKVIIVYDCIILVDKVVVMVKKNLVEGVVLVIVVFFLFFGNICVVLIIVIIILLLMLFIFIGMVGNRVSVNLMSFGVLDFGIIVDGVVVIVENVICCLVYVQVYYGCQLICVECFYEVFVVFREVCWVLVFGQIIIMVVYLLIFVFIGVEGKMFYLMVFIVVIVLFGVMIFLVIFVLVVIVLFIIGKVKEEENFVMCCVCLVYELVLCWVFGYCVLVVGGVFGVILFIGLVVLWMGSEFIFSFSEGDFVMQGLWVLGISLIQLVEMQQILERKLMGKFLEIEWVFVCIGIVEIVFDLMFLNVFDSYVMFKLQSQWLDLKKLWEVLLEELQVVVFEVLGSVYEFFQLIQLCFNELIFGVCSDVVVKVFGDDMQVFNDIVEKIFKVL